MNKRKNYFLIPEELDVEILIANNDPTQFMRKGRKFNLIKLLTVIDTIYQIMANPKENEFAKDNYTPVKLEYLRKYVDDAENYLKYLLNAEVILSDKHYIKNFKSKGYKFNHKYTGTPTVYETQKYDEEIHSVNFIGFDSNAKKLKHLRCWFNEKLTIDVEQALKEAYANYWQIDGEKLPIYFDGIDFSKVSNIGVKNEARVFSSKEHEKQYDGLLRGLVYPLATYQHKEFRFKVDDSGERLHTNLTNLKSTLRKHVKYEGKPIVSFDVKNSQPFFLNVITTEKFWTTSKNTQQFNIAYLQRPSKQFPSVYRRYTKDPLTMRAFVESQYETTFEQFKKVTLDGSLYEYIQNKHVELTGEVLERDRVKHELIKLLYAKSPEFRKYRFDIEYTINQVFPGLIEFCDKFKSDIEHNGLALLLQNVESTVILRIATANIAKKHPNMPLFTIHDSIATTDDYAPILAPLVTSEIEECVGLKPTIKAEKWA